MSSDPASAGNAGSGGRWFTTTHWSVVLAAHGAAPGAQEALEALCRTYWFPLYAYVRQSGYSPADAEDLTQEFFARFLADESFSRANPERGRFRTFLITALRRFLVSEWRRSRSQKRGGGQPVLTWDGEAAEQRYAAESDHALNPEEAYERRWALAIVEGVLAGLRAEYSAAGDQVLYDHLAGRLWGEAEGESWLELGTKLGLTEGALKQRLQRLRQRCRERLRAEVAHTVTSPEEVEDELRHLMNILSK
jgi:RNA polymerase sigma-70 factor (ECF subfamily)